MLIRTMGDLTPAEDAAVRLQARETFRRQVLGQGAEDAARAAAAESFLDQVGDVTSSPPAPAAPPRRVRRAASDSSSGVATASAAGGGDNMFMVAGIGAAALFGYLLFFRRGR